MKRSAFISKPLLASLLIALASLPPVAAQAQSSASARIPLFNGVNLDGFYTWLVDTRTNDPRRVFSVTNGMIRISGDGLGYLATTRSYENYTLTAQFKWGGKNWDWGARIGKARDSGIFLHASGPDGNSYDGRGAWMAALECNIFEGATGDFLLIRGADERGAPIHPRIRSSVAEALDADGWPFWRPEGQRRTLERWGRVNWLGKDRDWKDQFNFRGRRDVEKPAGEWNDIRCECLGGQIKIWVNGILVNLAEEVFPRRGKILLQCEGSEIFFRQLEIELDGKTRKVPGGTRLKLSCGDLFVPETLSPIQDQVPLTIHFHGVADVVERNFLEANSRGALLTVNARGLSAAYANLVTNSARWGELLAEAKAELFSDGRDQRLTPIRVSSFSAGFGAVRELLRQPAYGQIDSLIMADSIYCGFAEGASNRELDPEKMSGFMKFATEAFAGKKRMVVTHSSQPTAEYGSTTETASYLLKGLGVEAVPSQKEWAAGLKCLREFKKNGLQIYGFDGAGPEDHMTHLRRIALFYAAEQENPELTAPHRGAN